MSLRLSLALVLTLVPLALSASGPSQVPPGMARIEAGSFKLLYVRSGESTARVAAFAIDTVPVDQRAFLLFVDRYSQWAAGKTPARFADQRYLDGAGLVADRPITRVSWFAATAYCRARGARLPTTNEWEYLARASERRRDASSDAQFKQRVLQLALSRPSNFRIGSGFRNVWGVRDLHGGVTEWTQDFHTSFADPDSPRTGHSEHSITCASGTINGDASDYAAFLRDAFRTTAQARMTGANVGFRCALSL